MRAHRLGQGAFQSGFSRTLEQDLTNRVRNQPGGLHGATSVHLAEQRPSGDFRRGQPLLQRRHRAGFGRLPARDGDLSTFAFGIALGAPDQQFHAGARPGDVLHVESNQFGPPESPGEADQEQGTITGPGKVRSARAAQLLDLRRRQSGRSAGGRPMLPADPAECLPDRRVLGVKRMAGDPQGNRVKEYVTNR